MIYKGLNRTGTIGDIKTNGGGEIAEVYGGIWENDPIYFKQREIVGTSPMQFKALGLPLKDYRIYGETLQDGTPSPDYPVDVQCCGEKTGNLAPDTGWVDGYITANGGTNSADKVRLEKASDFIPLRSEISLAYSYRGGSFPKGDNETAWRAIGFFRSDKTFISRISDNAQETLFAQVPDDTAYIRLSLRTYGQDVSNNMLNTGSTALPYEPYGYKLPVTTTNGTDTVTTPIYIGSEPLHRIGEYADYVDYSSGKIMRRIKKLVLTGEEEFRKNDTQSTDCLYVIGLNIIFPGAIDRPLVFCNELPTKDDYPTENIGIYTTNYYYKVAYFNFGASVMNAQPSGNTAAGLKEYLAAQYAAGTPVTVWYVLQEPLEEDPPVPFPELTTLSGTNTLTVDTTVKPSEIDLTGRIKTSG